MFVWFFIPVKNLLRWAWTIFFLLRSLHSTIEFGSAFYLMGSQRLNTLFSLNVKVRFWMEATPAPVSSTFSGSFSYTFTCEGRREKLRYSSWLGCFKPLLAPYKCKVLFTNDSYKNKNSHWNCLKILVCNATTVQKLLFQISSKRFINGNTPWAAIPYFLHYLTTVQRTDSNYWSTQALKHLKICNLHLMQKHNHHDSKRDQ